MKLASEHCVPCRGGVPAMDADQIDGLMPQLPGWIAVEHHHLSRTFAFEGFTDALAFVNQVAAIAEAEGHHPDVWLRWGSVQLDIWTHKIDGLTYSDFVLAAKCSDLLTKAR